MLQSTTRTGTSTLPVRALLAEAAELRREGDLGAAHALDVAAVVAARAIACQAGKVTR